MAVDPKLSCLRGFTVLQSIYFALNTTFWIAEFKHFKQDQKTLYSLSARKKRKPQKMLCSARATLVRCNAGTMLINAEDLESNGFHIAMDCKKFNPHITPRTKIWSGELLARAQKATLGTQQHIIEKIEFIFCQ